MTRDDILRMAREAGGEIYEVDWCFEIENLERFAALVATAERRKHQADIERWKAKAVTAEKWRGLAISRDGDGRSVQTLWAEAAAAEREACAKACDAEAAKWPYPSHANAAVTVVATAIRARQDEK